MQENDLIKKLLEEKAFSATIKELLDIKETTTKELARKTKIPATTLYSSVNKPMSSFSVGVLRSIFIALDIPLAFLVQLTTSDQGTKTIELTHNRVRRQEDLLHSYSQLSAANQDKVIDYSNDLYFSEKYKSEM